MVFLAQRNKGCWIKHDWALYDEEIISNAIEDCDRWSDAEWTALCVEITHWDLEL